MSEEADSAVYQERLVEIFQSCDSNNKGYLSLLEFERLCRQLQLQHQKQRLYKDLGLSRTSTNTKVKKAKPTSNYTVTITIQTYYLCTEKYAFCKNIVIIHSAIQTNMDPNAKTVFRSTHMHAHTHTHTHTCVHTQTDKDTKWDFLFLCFYPSKLWRI